MASIKPHGNRYRAQVKIEGRRTSCVFNTKRQALAWAQEQEAQLAGDKLPDKTFAEALKEYRLKRSEPRGADKECVRLLCFEKTNPLANRRLLALRAEDFIKWRDDRLKQVKPASVAREMNLLRSVLEYARKELRWLKVNPMSDVTWPQCPKGRARGVEQWEIDAIATALGVGDVLRAETATQRVGLAFLFAIETAMRSGEILALRWSDIHKAERYVTIRKSKNGDARDVPLSSMAVQILDVLPLGFGPAFGLDDASRDALYRKMRPAECREVHFHDTRSEGITRMSKKLDILDLARVIGHRDLKSLMHYYAADASALAKRLG